MCPVPFEPVTPLPCAFGLTSGWVRFVEPERPLPFWPACSVLFEPVTPLPCAFGLTSGWVRFVEPVAPPAVFASVPCAV